MKNKKEALHNALKRSVSMIYPSREAMEAAILNSKKFKIYIGIDATGPHLHLGHLTNLLILRRLQKLGVKVVLLVGDFTARIGDPTGKSTGGRKPLTEHEIKENFKTFKSQISKIISFTGPNAAIVAFNSKWHDKMTLKKFLELKQLFTVQQLDERDMFMERRKANIPIGAHEYDYPILQGYDSVALNTDAEMGGTDQTFNMLIGRTMMRILKHKEKFVVTTTLLTHPVTEKKLMNKSEGGLINLDDSADDIFGKVMALDDASMFAVAEHCTEMPLERMRELQDGVAGADLNPRDAKLEIGEAVVSVIHGKKTADIVRKKFVKLFSKKEMPGDVRELSVTLSVGTAQALVMKSGVVKSSGEAWRLIKQGALEIDGKKITDPRAKPSGKIAKIGKHHFFRLKVR